MQQLIDSHVHLDMIQKYHPQRIQWLRENHCGVVSWSYFAPPDSTARLKKELQKKARFIRELSDAGMQCHYLAGVHPRSIPPDLRPEAIDSLLTPHMDDPCCLGIGEIGLETGDMREQEILIAQLEIGRRIAAEGKVTGIHTPRSNKIAMTKLTLKILSQFSDVAASMVVDHCTVRTIRTVLESGFRAGVTLSPEKTSCEEMLRMVALCPDYPDRMMCNSDSGSNFFEDFVRCSRNSGLDEKICARLFGDNAARFFYAG